MGNRKENVRRARLFRNAGNLAVRFPVDWGISAEEAVIRFDGTTITVTPMPPKPLSALLEHFAKEPVPDDWTDPNDQAPEPVQL